MAGSKKRTQKRPAKTSRKASKKASRKSSRKPPRKLIELSQHRFGQPVAVSDNQQRAMSPHILRFSKRPSVSPVRAQLGVSKASLGMKLSDLQALARLKGIPFGGLNKERLVDKINTY